MLLITPGSKGITGDATKGISATHDLLSGFGIIAFYRTYGLKCLGKIMALLMSFLSQSL